jgi:peptide/nickel transport system ATP-binding protein/oligopeptide transport system ATP-binding protein
MTALLEIAGLRTEFGPVVAVDGVDLDVREAECLGVVGESGSGKTVTFLSVLGLLAPPGRVVSGSARFAGEDLLALPEPALRRHRGRDIALTFQDAHTALNPALTVAEQISEVLAAHGRPGSPEELLRLVGIPDAGRRLRNYPHQFSGGMRQRVMLAIALACRPRLLIADEPTSALDVTVQAQVLDLIARLRAELGMAVVLITHDLGVVAEHCARVAVMYAGQVVELGPVAEVLRAPRHPYTRGLLEAVPWVDELDAPLRPMPGQVPLLPDLPPGCRFQPRCPVALPACVAPVAMRGEAAHRARCVRAA